MTCGCSSQKKTQPRPWVLDLPDGRQKSYYSEIAARNEHQRVPGSVLTPPSTVV